MDPGARVGPYHVLSRLGAGGMGEVWRARDERLGRDVAIKVLPAEFAADPERLARFEREARATAALSHPNILAIHDVGIHDEQPYLVEELLEGESLRVRLLDGPLPVREALELGVQIARGLAAAHDKRIVHRDLKPDNVVLTRDGTAKILDFGLAKIVEVVSGEADTITQAPASNTGPGRVLGSAAYMAPEQARGLPVDHRADIFAFGVLLHELLSGSRPFGGHTVSDTMAAILKDEPAPLPASVPSPVQAVILRCLEKKPEDRFGSARDLAFAIQALIESAPRTAAKLPDQERPYPGLAAFTAADAKRFFGRDEEIAALWRKIPGRSLLALIGPSGVGKTSFIRAGLVPHAPPGWRCLVATPGQAPFGSLARALAPFFSGDTEAVQQLLDVHIPETAVGLVQRWRQRADHGLIVVDQFEELFTLNGEDTQHHFAGLLGKLSAIDGVHVLLSTRDDFFFSCHRLAPLAEVFQDVTPLGPLSADGLRRALVEPAKGMGFAFEDEGLVEEMLQAVAGERGALPLLAFAAASLWEQRSKEAKTLTRSAYEAIGGVAGALAQHAEATLDHAGQDKLPLVRELFRNLVTAQGTRAGRDGEELLTVFPEAERGDARDALARLVDARLLTAFEVEGPDGSRHDRVEIVHESLLTAWPRLVRWRSEDEGGAHLRDQFRQAAHLWEEKGRPDDLLWTGTSYREFALWRERYPGGLSEVEEAFGRAMVARAGRRRRARRIAVAAGFAVLLGVVAVIGTSLRRTRTALARTDASRLVALGRAVGSETDPAAVLAHAIASLERADSVDGRMLALDAMAHGPMPFVAPSRDTKLVAFSPDGRWLAAADWVAGDVWVFGRYGSSLQLRAGVDGELDGLRFAPGCDVLVTTEDYGDGEREVRGRAWSLSDGRLLGELTWRKPAVFGVLRDPPRMSILELAAGRAELRTLRLDQPGAPALAAFDLSRYLTGWPMAEYTVGTRTFPWMLTPAVDPAGRWLAFSAGGRIFVQPLEAGSTPRLLATGDARLHASSDGAILVARGPRGPIRLLSAAAGVELGSFEVEELTTDVRVSEDGHTLLVRTAGKRTESELPGGTLLAWRLPRETRGPGRTIELPSSALGLATDRGATWVGVPRVGQPAQVWCLRWPAEARPLVLRDGPDTANFSADVASDGHWVATALVRGVAVRPLRERSPLVLGGHTRPVNSVVFAPDGSWVASTGQDPAVRLWPLAGSPPPPSRQLTSWADQLAYVLGIGVSPDGRTLAVGSAVGKVTLVSVDGALRPLTGFTTGTSNVAFSRDGRLAAAGGVYLDGPGIRVWEVASGKELALLDPGVREATGGVAFLPDGSLASTSVSGVRLWDLAARTSRVVWAPEKQVAGAFAGGVQSSTKAALVFSYYPSPDTGDAYIIDGTNGPVRRLDRHGGRVVSAAIDPTGTIVATGDLDGVVRVGRATGEEPHLLLGHRGWPFVAISSQGDWVASGGQDTTVRLWPMPDLTKPPVHTLPLPELLARLKAQTNVRLVADAAAPGGHRTEFGPFPGWAEVPTWEP